ncbi:MAG TPA: hypothetical protein VFD63_04895 [Pyrinomonadaceae bacterium]|nr:hypothetical protein [Pyrinomonadaceae bacterium]
MRTVKALPVLILLITLSSVRAQEKKLGVFEGKDDVGNPARVGNAVYDPEKQEYLVEGAGTNMWANRDVSVCLETAEGEFYSKQQCGLRWKGS